MSPTPPCLSFAAVTSANQLLCSHTLATFTVLLFDHCLTLSDEVKYIWRRKLTHFSVLFLVNRYFALVALIFPVASLFAWGWNVQGMLLFGHFFITIIIAEAMLILRVYAVHQSNKLILGILLTAWAIHIGLMAYQFRLPFISFYLVASPTAQCYALPTANRNIGIMTIAPAIGFDTIVLWLLISGLYSRYKLPETTGPLSQLIMRDGILYFAAIFATNAAWLIANIISGTTVQTGLLDLPSSTLTTIMINRLTLNIRMHDPSKRDSALPPISHDMGFNHLQNSTDGETPGTYPGTGVRGDHEAPVG